MAHKADGLYYVSSDMLLALRACGLGREDYAKAFPLPGITLITQENVEHYLRSAPSYIAWPLYNMLDKYVPTPSSQHSAVHYKIDRLMVEYGATGSSADVKLAERFMDIVWEIHTLRESP